MTWAGYVPYSGRNANWMKETRHRWEYNIKMDLTCCVKIQIGFIKLRTETSRKFL
jgi:hypothetical protein